MGYILCLQGPLQRDSEAHKTHNYWDIFKNIFKFSTIKIPSLLWKSCVLQKVQEHFALSCFHTIQSYVVQNKLDTALSLLNQLLSTS